MPVERSVVARWMALALASSFVIGASPTYAAQSAAADAAQSAAAVPAPGTFTLDDPRTATNRRVVVVAPSAEAGVAFSRVPQVVLAAPDAKAIVAQDAARAALSSDKVLRYGVGRALAVDVRDGIWTELPDGRLWVLEVGSAGALALRLRFTGLHLPSGARLVVLATGSDAATQEPWEAPAAGGAEIWSPSVIGETVRVEYREPVDARSDALPFRLDRLQHVYLDPVRAVAGGGAWSSRLAAGTCNNDVTCHPEWKREARAVAGIGVIGQDSLFCTGQLINDLAKDYTPYFLTANHCVSAPKVARTAELYWFYQTRACGEAPPTLASVPRSAGATLLSANVISDYALLRIDGRLPHGVAWVGWTARPVADGTAAAVIHHPSGDFKRISFGDKDSALECGGGHHLRIRWTDGPTESGSSGSGAFRADTHQLFGQLHCGPSACGEETYDQFGSFAATYPRIASWLASGSDDDTEPNETCATARLIAAGTLTDRVVTYRSPDWFKVRVPRGRTLRVTLRFAHQDGAVEASLVTVCGQTPKAVSGGPRDAKVLQFTNAGAATTLSWKVDLPDDLRNAYTMLVEIR